MPIDPNQIIMDVPLHRTVWKGQTTFEQNVLPNDYVWAQCQVAVCNTLDGPNNCQASYTPRPYPAEKFKMAAKGWDFTVDVVACRPQILVVATTITDKDFVTPTPYSVVCRPASEAARLVVNLDVCDVFGNQHGFARKATQYYHNNKCYKHHSKVLMSVCFWLTRD